MNNKPLRRIQQEAVLGGVAAGFADYFGMDKALMRVIFVLLLIFTKGFPIFLLYIILWAALPTGESTMTEATPDWASPKMPPTQRGTSRGTEFVGYGLLLIGGFMLFDRLFYWIHLQKFIPAAVLIVLGIFLIIRHKNSPETPSINTDRATPSWTDDAPINQWQPQKYDDSSETPSEPEEPKTT
ncbi:MAG: PspC domain-containing protein [Spirosomataceae bacterium]